MNSPIHQLAQFTKSPNSQPIKCEWLLHSGVWSVAILGMWSIGIFFVPAALAGSLATLTFSLGRPTNSGAAIIWFAIGLTALCAFNLLYARSLSYAVRWSGGFATGRVTVPPVMLYGAWIFALLVSLVASAAIFRRLAGSRR